MIKTITLNAGRRFAELEMKIILTKVRCWTIFDHFTYFIMDKHHLFTEMSFPQMVRRFNLSVNGPLDAELPVEHETIFRPAVPVKIKLSLRV